MIPFPHLRFVELSGDFLKVGAGPRHRGPTSQVISVDKLEKILERREALGVPLQRLEIHLDPDDTHRKYLDQLRGAAQNTVIQVQYYDSRCRAASFSRVFESVP